MAPTLTAALNRVMLGPEYIRPLAKLYFVNRTLSTGGLNPSLRETAGASVVIFKRDGGSVLGQMISKTTGVFRASGVSYIDEECGYEPMGEP